jgi:hypothetical protein
MLINILQRYINLEDRVKILNIQTMDNFMSSNNHLEIDADHQIEKYKKEYDIKLESDKFKKTYLNSKINEQKDTFITARLNHLIRQDIKI